MKRAFAQGQAGRGHDVAADRDDEAGPGGQPHALLHRLGVLRAEIALGDPAV